MLRKIFILGLVIMLLISMMSGCISTGYLNEGSSTIEEQTTTTPVPTTTPMNKDAISAQLAQLTNEDGTGIIRLEMSSDEIAAKLDEYGIPYNKNEFGTISTNDESVYIGGVGGYFKVKQTKSGLKVGDPLSRVVELYGKPDEKIDGDKCYIYETGKTSYDRPINLQVQMVDGIVDIIFIKVRDIEYHGGAE